jgi:hypothetical protein
LSEAPRSFLSVLGGPLDGKRVVLEDSEELLIGSDPGCKLCLNLPGVSPIHARLWRGPGGAQVYDTRSPQGLYVNDDAVSGERSVQDGDVLWLGPPGAPDSVMIQVRLASPAAPAFDVAPAGDAVFIVEDKADADPPPTPVVAAEDLVFELDAPGGPAPATRSESRETRPERGGPPAADEVFFLDEIEAPAPSGTPAQPIVEEFLFEDDAPPAPAAAPVRPPASAAKPPAPRAAAPAPAVPAPSLPKAPAVPPPPPAATVKPPAAPPRPHPEPDVFVVDDAAIAAAQATAPPARPAAAAPRPAVAARPVASPRPAAPPAARPSARPMPRRSAAARRLPLVGAAALVLAGGAAAALRLLGAPQLEAVSPTRVRVGDAVVLRGKNFSARPAENSVTFSGKPGRVIAASATELRAEVPVLSTSPGRDASVEVKVAVKGRETPPARLAVFQSPRIHALSPNVGMPGDDVQLAGSLWGDGVKVFFDGTPAQIIELSAASMRVRVPALEAASGSEVKVTVSMGADASNAAAFVVGRLPLVRGVTPPAAAPGDVVTLAGLGFRDAASTDVRIGAKRALVVSAGLESVGVMVPFLDAGGETPVEVRVPGSDHVGRAALTLSEPADPLQLRFSAEPLDGGPSQAAVTTALGPTFLLATAAGRGARERAAEAAQRLNEAAAAIRASPGADFVARGFEAVPMLTLAGRDEAILTATGADAALYEQRGGGRAPLSPARLAVWWEAVARDLVRLLVRGEKPDQVASYSAGDGRALGDLHAAALRSGAAGVPRAALAEAKPAQLAALRGFALRVPGSVPSPAGAPGATAAPGTAAGGPPLPSDRSWQGFEIVDGIRRWISLSLRGTGGTYSYSGGVQVSLQLSGVEQRKTELRFVVQTGGRSRHYAGRWDGSGVAGRISSDASGSGDIGSFELTPR